MRRTLASLRESYPLGALIILTIAVITTFLVSLREPPPRAEIQMWCFARDHSEVFNAFGQDWASRHDTTMKAHLLSFEALERRMMSGFFSGTPVADLIEAERSVGPRSWRGPLDAVGFVDMTDLLEESGLKEKINAPSFSPWTSRGRIFGVPLDVHPVLLTYRADIFEAAGIDVSTLDTWDKFMAAASTLIGDFDGDGVQDRYVLELSETDAALVSVFVLQAGVDYFDAEGRPQLTHPRIAEILCRLALWAAPPNKLTGDVELFSGAGNVLRINGFVLAWVTPDWRARQTREYMQPLAGKVKLMPLPAWEPGGLRTSVWGGTMLGVTRASPNREMAIDFVWDAIQNRSLAQQFWRRMNILTPMKAFWDDPVYDEPNETYSGQPIGRLFIEQAANVPMRSSSVYFIQAQNEIGGAFNRLVAHARETRATTVEDILPECERLLERAQKQVMRQMSRNIFATPPPQPAAD